jgi:DNA damage-binding protein 1
MLLVTTTHYKMLTLSLRMSSTDNAASPQFNIVSDSLTELEDRHSRASDVGQIVIVDPTSSLVCCHLYCGMLKCITVNPSPVNPSASHGHQHVPTTRSSGSHAFRLSSKNADKTFLDQFNLPIEEVTVMSMVFLHGCQRPTLAVLYQDKKEVRHVKTFEFDLKIKDKVETGWIQSGLAGAMTCIAVPSPIGNYHVHYGPRNRSLSPNVLAEQDRWTSNDLATFTLVNHRGFPCTRRIRHLILQPVVAHSTSLDYN